MEIDENSQQKFFISSERLISSPLNRGGGQTDRSNSIGRSNNKFYIFFQNEITIK